MGFKRFDPEDLVISNAAVTTAAWSNNAPTLTEYFVDPAQTGSASSTSEYYYNVYQTASSDTSAAVQFGIAYCDLKGSGSDLYNILVDGASPTRTNYGQYRTLVLGDENASFTFGNQTTEYFYALNIERARYKESLLPGTMTLYISGSGGMQVLTDDSGLGGAVTFTDAGRRFNLVSGSAGSVYTGVNTSGWTSNSGSYGWFLPDVGLILLSGPALDGAFADGGVALGTARNPNTADYNQELIFDSFNAAGASGNGFTLNSKETLSSDFIFVRARNAEFNYSENPSFISGSTGEVIFNSFIDNPQTYITTVGLYNDNNELLATAKLSRPLLKDFTKELLVRVKLDF
jgi:hypothetical protein